ncbi:biotin-dependent carboxyltransferase family protein [Halalkalibacter akibai]|uniref:Allophanate hydrolase 2 subunit 2 n=1 Tax=Halalkalibacter akibai (strain ATCC 43226 / DSM 21942 / CIP 109018 / JCM 9157 / 1139) TaxID=1236973 RepID=W4QXQ5_HALA3|nr:biotin-dependent carboxyltransferase family protein [Halalkalibacter akibai]GAE36881.1 allophanate hydrolase 2 subunit 2 [Halalkalibacter akibai JCM 9157]
MTFTVLKPGLLTTIQDLGRYGYQKYGVIVSGAMDSFSTRLANLIVGNNEQEGVLEITLNGPVLRFEEDTLIVITGADLSPVIDQKRVSLNKPIYVKGGAILSFGPVKSGCRSYLACAGGFAIEEILGSKSTYIRAGIGGFEGRALKQGDRVKCKPPSDLARKLIAQLRLIGGGSSFQSAKWSVSQRKQSSKGESIVHLIRGSHFDLFTEKSIKALFHQRFTVSQNSDRMGYQLTGYSLQTRKAVDIFSEAIAFGTIQVPAEGNPIILLADRQTVGGYPRIAQVIATDLDVIAQLKPGDVVKFEEITLASAEQLYLERERELMNMKTGISLKMVF